MTPSVSLRDLGGRSTEPGTHSSEATDRLGKGEPRNLAWQREMERAQTEAWFSGFVPLAAQPTLATRAFVAPPARVQMAAASTAGEFNATGDMNDAASLANVSPCPDPALVSSLDQTAPHSNNVAQSTKDGSNALTPSIAPAIRGASPASSFDSDRSSCPHHILTVVQRSEVPASFVSESAFIASSDTSDAAAITPTALLPLPAGTAGKTAADGRPTSARLADALRALEALPDPIQLHVQWSADGAKVWLGLAGSASAQLPELIDMLARSLNKHGLRLRSVVCNGVSCYQQPGGDPHATGVDVQLTTSSEKD